MEKKDLSKKDLFDVLKHGCVWHSEKIKAEVEKLVVMNSRAFEHELRYDHGDKFYFIYDNECYLFIFDGKIEARSDRDNTYSGNKTVTYPINEAQDILAAYERFKSMTMEDDEG